MKNYFILSILFFYHILTPTDCFAQNNQPFHTGFLTDNPLKSHLDSLVDQRVRAYFKDKWAVGLSLGIVINGNALYYNYGETRSGNSGLPSKMTLHEIGSMTKSFTGILLAQAVIDKKIALGDDIRKYLKGDYPNLVHQATPIRIRDLTNHTSRITRIFPNLWERATTSSCRLTT